jgi:hypothetical protein
VAYGGVVADPLLRAGSIAQFLVPGAAVGALLLAIALLVDDRALGPALWLAGGTYIAFLAATHQGVDAGAPLVAVGLLLCGELAAWSFDERWRFREDPRLVWRRAGAIGALALAGLALATMSVALTAVPASHGLVWTLVGAVAAIGAAGTGIVLARK